MPRLARAGRSAAARRTVSSAWPNRWPVISREWSSMKANRYVLRPPMTGPCNASPVHISVGRRATQPRDGALPDRAVPDRAGGGGPPRAAGFFIICGGHGQPPEQGTGGLILLQASLPARWPAA